MMQKKSEKILHQGKWLSFLQFEFINNRGEVVTWEAIQRNNTPLVLIIIAKLIPSNQYALIKQFRPAINKFVLGLPAGITQSDNIKPEALRELLEETGYTGTIKDISPVLALSPALTNEPVRIVTAEIDENDLRNANPKQTLEPAEEIEVVLVPTDSTREFLLNQRAQGLEIGAALWFLFGGILQE